MAKTNAKAVVNVADGISGIKAKLDELKAAHEAKLKEDQKKVVAPLEDKLAQLMERRKEIEAEQQNIEKMLVILGYALPKTTVNGRQQRRSLEDLQELAKEIHAFVKTKGKDGVSARDLVARFGKVQPSAAPFVEKYGQGLKLKTTGAKASTRYFTE